MASLETLHKDLERISCALEKIAETMHKMSEFDERGYAREVHLVNGDYPLTVTVDSR